MEASHTSDCQRLWETCFLLLAVGVTCTSLRSEALGSETRQSWGSWGGEPQGLTPPWAHVSCSLGWSWGIFGEGQFA